MSQPGLSLTRRTRNQRIDTSAGFPAKKLIRPRCRSGRVSFDALATAGLSRPPRTLTGTRQKETRAMRFLMMTKGDPSATGNPLDENLMMEMGKLIEDMTKPALLLATAGLHPTA